MNNSTSDITCNPLEVKEVIRFLRDRWGVTYELKLLKRGKSLYLQIMWGFLEQQSFPLSNEEYLVQLSEIVEIINRSGTSDQVRDWLLNVEGKPRLGRALSLPLKMDEKLNEFVL